ncbi:MAG: sulfotransferase [Proteobacteria bacterium]|nr:sulfotransferase [Pseudomonadota bacterium]
MLLLETHAGLMRQLTSLGERASTLMQLSKTEMQLGHARASVEYALRAAKVRPENLEVLSGTLAQLRITNKAEEFLAYVARLGPLTHLPIPVLLAIAREFSFFNLQEKAANYVAEALRGDPDFPPALLAQAQLSTYSGNLRDALANLRKALRRAPEIPETYWLLAQLGKTARGGMDDANMAEAQLPRAGGNVQGGIHLNYALHRFHDDDGNYDQAFAHLRQGMQAKRSTLHYSTAETRRLFDLLKSLPTAVSVAGQEAGWRQPIFIVGMHRSGTTLLEQLLGAHPDVRDIGELYDFTSAMRHETDCHCRGVIDPTLVERTLATAPDYAAVGKKYLEGLNWRLGAERMFTDKLPSNFLNIGFIAQALPGARILHMTRDPVETCFSNLRELFSDANPYSYDQIEIAEYYAMYRELMAHWKARFPGRILDIDYGRLTADTGTVMEEVSDFCGLEFVPGMMDTNSSRRSVATASAVQVREGVVRRDVPKWKPYERDLQPLMSRLAELGIN